MTTVAGGATFTMRKKYKSALQSGRFFLLPANHSRFSYSHSALRNCLSLHMGFSEVAMVATKLMSKSRAFHAVYLGHAIDSGARAAFPDK